MTVSVATTLQTQLDRANLSTIDAALAKVNLGTILTPLKRVFTAITASATVDLTALDADDETVGAANTKRLAMLVGTYVRVDASGTAGSVGNYIVGPPTSTLLIPPGGANAAVGVCRISDDGKTLTFPNTITGLTVAYVPRSAVDMTLADRTLQP